MMVFSFLFKNRYPEISDEDRKNYLLPKQIDYEILTQCKLLEKMKLSKEDKILVQLIKSQLEKDWRKPLTIKLKQLLTKYK